MLARLVGSGPTSYQVSRVKPTFTVTCQSVTLLFSRWPRTSATSNHFIFRIVLPARVIALFTASFDTVWRRTDQLNLFVDVVTHKRIKPLHVASGEHIPRSNGAGFSEEFGVSGRRGIF